MLAIVRLVRPLNAVMAALGVVVGALVAIGPLSLTDPSERIAVLLASIAALLITGGGNALNDVVDAQVDAVAHPRRPIPSGELGLGSVRRIALILFASGVLLCVVLLVRSGRPLPLVVALFNCALLWAYERRLKVAGLSGNVAVAYLSGSVFLFGALAVLDLPSNGASLQLGAAAILVGLALLANLAREVAKDLQDIEGDRGHRQTFPMTSGTSAARRVVVGTLCAAVAASVLPTWPLHVFAPLPYLPLVLAADATFLYAAATVAATPARCADAAKVAMLIALAAFVAGAVGMRG